MWKNEKDDHLKLNVHQYNQCTMHRHAYDIKIEYDEIRSDSAFWGAMWSGWKVKISDRSIQKLIDVTAKMIGDTGRV